MSRKINYKNSVHSYSVNDSIGVERMPIDDAVSNKSFGYKTGIRKYRDDDPSVAKMHKDRSRTYRKYGIGMPVTMNTPKQIQAVDSKGLISEYLTGKRSLIKTNVIDTIDNVDKFIHYICKVNLSEGDRLRLSRCDNINIRLAKNESNNFRSSIDINYVSSKSQAGGYTINIRNLDFKELSKIKMIKTGETPRTILQIMRQLKKRKIHEEKVKYRKHKWSNYLSKDKTLANPIRGIDKLK